MYQALYRKYRPSNLEDVVGQDVLIKILENAILKNQLSHAYLFSGPRGTGKTSIAKIIAKIVNCTSLEGIKPCNVCVNCTQLNNKQSTDIIEIDAASNNGVDEIRELRSKINLVPSTGKYKVYIVDEVHMLTTGAFNALLKTLEEPPSHIIFILATTEPHKIPSTILSRCQRFEFKKITNNDIVKRLKQIVECEKIDIDELALFEIARLSDGGMRDAISMLDQVNAYCTNKITAKDVHDVNGTLTQEELTEFVLNLISGDILNLFNKIDLYNSSGKNLIKLTEEIILFLRNLLLYITVPNYFKDSNFDTSIYMNLVDKTNKEKLFELISEFNLSINDMKYSSNPKIILELSIIKMIQKIENIDLKTEYKLSEESKDERLKKENDVIDKKEENKINIEENRKNNTKNIEKEISKKIKTDLIEIKKIRINNTLAHFDKKILIKLSEQIKDIRSLILDSKYRQYASIIIDGELKAASKDNMIFVYPTEHMSDLFNENLIIIENIIKEMFNYAYKVIATSSDDWNIIKQEFNSKNKVYSYIKEEFNLNDILNNEEAENDDIKNIFGDLVEYK